MKIFGFMAFAILALMNLYMASDADYYGERGLWLCFLLLAVVDAVGAVFVLILLK